MCLALWLTAVRAQGASDQDPCGLLSYRVLTCQLTIRSLGYSSSDTFVSLHANLEIGRKRNDGTGAMAGDTSCQRLERVHAHGAIDIQLNRFAVCSRLNEVRW